MNIIKVTGRGIPDKYLSIKMKTKPKKKGGKKC